MITPAKKFRNFTVVVGGGGIKAMAAVPFFAFLTQQGLVPTRLFGCSGGVFVPCFWAKGIHEEEKMLEAVYAFQHRVANDKLFNDIDYRTLLGVANYPFGRFKKENALLFPNKFFSLCQSISDGLKLEDLPIPTILQATDLDTAEPVFLETGDLASAIYASSALYPVLPPIQIENKWLVDGAYHSETPLMEAVKRTNDLIIVLTFDQVNDNNPSSFFKFFTGFINQVVRHHTLSHTSLALNMHQNDILFLRHYFKAPISIWDVKKMPEIIEMGRSVLKSKEREILNALEM